MSESMQERFTIQDDRSAEWALQKIREAKADTERWKAFYAEQLEKIERQNDDTVAYFSALLEAFFDTVPHKVTKTQEAYKLPGGKLVRKAQQPAYEKDPEVLLAWAESTCPEAVKIKKEAAWEVVKRRIACVGQDGVAIDEETGEIIPGVRIIPREPVFQVQMGKEEDSHGVG